MSARKTVLAVTAVVLVTTVVFTGKSPNAAESGERFVAPLTAIPVEQQIQLALSAAPPEISQQATVYVLESKGYVKVRTGTNGFTCLVERQYPGTLEPTCYDAEGSATTLQARLYREELRAAGIPEAEIQKKIDAEYKTGTLKAPRKPGLAYMLSTQNKAFSPIDNRIVHVPPHLMFYAPYTTNKDLGGFLGMYMPHVIFEGQPDAFIIVVPALMSAAPQQPAGATGIK